MSTHARTSAEKKFTANLKKVQLAKTETDLAQKSRMEHIAKLRALRLAKEATDRDIEIRNKANKKTRKPARARSKPESSPQTAAKASK